MDYDSAILIYKLEWDKQFQVQLRKLQGSNKELDSTYFHKLCDWIQKSESGTKESYRRLYTKFSNYFEAINKGIE